MLLLAMSLACSPEPDPTSEHEGDDVSECWDGADNDGDGDFDCHDSECASLPDCAEADADTDTDTDTDSDTDSDSDSDSDVDTALAKLFYSGDAQTAQGSFVDGHFGFTLYSMSFTELCLAQSRWSDTGAPAPPCPQCDWAFNLGLSGGTAIGSACAGIGFTGGEWDGFTASWGFANTYIYNYGGTPYTYDLAVLYYNGYYGWVPLAHNYAGYGYNTGDETDMRFLRFYTYVYYYP